ncbi:hypothetical protein IMG5_156430, partial [Ichthyophthirius multifiliis]
TESQITKKTFKKELHKQLFFFINPINTFLGHSLVECLRNDHQNDINPHMFTGALSEKESNQVPRGVWKTINNKVIQNLIKVLLDVDIIIYDLNNCDLDEAQLVIQTLKMGEFKEQKTLIFISSVVTWSKTSIKEKILKENQLAELKTQESDIELGSQIEEDEQLSKKIYTKYNENEYLQRKSHPKYERMKQLETLCLSINNLKPNLRSYVICSGIQYGNGEDVFYELFKEAWLQNTQELTVYGNGKNRIPTIHIKDLANFVSKTIEITPNQNYILALDKSKSTQLSIVEAISRKIGTGKVRHIDLASACLDKDNFFVLNLDLRLKGSKLFDFQEIQDDEQGVENIQQYQQQFIWHCRNGIEDNMETLNKEFNQYRGLKSNKIVIFGPPCSGKTFIGKKLAQQYNIPYIQIQELIEQIQNQDNLDLGVKVKNYLIQKREELTRIALTQFEADKKKKRIKKGDPEPVFDPQTIDVRLNEELLFEVYKYRLSQVDCINKGYVLDAFPKTNIQAQNIFQNKQQQHEELLYPLCQLPDSFIILEANDEFLKEKAKSLSQEVIKNTHWNDEGMNRRLRVYKQIIDNENLSIVSFFQENQVDVLKINIQNNENIFQNIQQFIERNGSFNSFGLDKKQSQSSLKNNRLSIQEEYLQKKSILEEKIKLQKEEEIQKNLQKETFLKIEKLKNQERERLAERSQALRQYLADNIVPYLTEGLIQVCQTNPDNPIEAL